MEEQERIEQIEAYVMGNMSEGDSKAFEQRLSEDVDLANEWKVYQELQSFLSDTSKNQFRATLEQVRTESDVLNIEKTNGNVFNWWWIAIVIPFLLMLLFLFLRPENDEQPIEIPNTESESTEPSDPPIEIESPNEEEQDPPIVPEITEDPKEKIPPPIIKKSPPIAANFEVNLLLENEMREGLRGGEIDVQLDQPTDNAQFSSGESVFFAGKLDTDYTLDELDLRLLIFSNKVADYQNFEPIEEQNLILNEDLTFKFISTPTLSKGLYYFIIEDLNEEMFLKVGKFEIR